MTKREAAKACRWFQREIGLAGWTIEVHIGNQPSGDMGTCTVHYRLHKAVIWIVIKESLETLMHELLHVAFDSFGIDMPEISEHLIDRLAIALAGQYKQWLQA